MNQDFIRKWTRAQPFRPFRLRLTDGTVYDIHDPDLVAASRNEAVVIAPSSARRDGSAHDEPFFVSYFHILEIQPVPFVTPGAGGEDGAARN